MKRNYTIEDITDYLDELGFIWMENLIKDYEKGKYFQATPSTLKREMYIYIKNKNSSNKTVAKLKIGNNTFILHQGTATLDMSEDWKNYLSSKLEVNA